MARLQRKKTSGSKKKKKQSFSLAVSPRVENDAEPKKTELFAGSAKDTKKRQVSYLKRLSSGVSPEQGKLGNFLHRGIGFLREVKVELKKVTWPTRKQTVGSTVVMLILVIIISFFLGAIDIGLSSIIRVVFQ